MRDIFSRFAARVAILTGTPWAFLVAFLIILIWAISGPLFHFSDTWQLVINTGTTIVTFLMVFLIQNSQNRDSTAIQLKLDELIRAVDTASNRLIDVEDDSDDNLERLRRAYQWQAERQRNLTGKDEPADDEGDQPAGGPRAHNPAALR
ncbi:MAG TPA: low affinity iron permease family protein [Thermomicrobiales bacterium]|nr:low affinity iron permease family protein [Thermomicrobiales bacterium]